MIRFLSNDPARHQNRAPANGRAQPLPRPVLTGRKMPLTCSQGPLPDHRSGFSSSPDGAGILAPVPSFLFTTTRRNPYQSMLTSCPPLRRRHWCAPLCRRHWCARLLWQAALCMLILLVAGAALYLRGGL